MHSRATVAEALRLRDEEGLGARRVARRLGVPLATVRDWHAGRLPRNAIDLIGVDGVPPLCERCGHEPHQFGAFGDRYVYLLGLYLGDGSISPHPRGVFRLRVSLDKKYPGIVEECSSAISVVMPGNEVGRRLTASNCWEVWSYSRSWPCLIPQHGLGKKHERRIWLGDWQQQLAARWPKALIRGMIQTDGCRFMNTGRGGWRHPRYEFRNVSSDVTSIFRTACDCLDLHWTAAFPSNESKAISIYVSRKADVARMDEFVGPKA